jgi:uncharacterized protein
MADILLPGVPPLSWEHRVTDVSMNGGELRLAAAPRTDWVADAATGELVLSAPAVGFAAPKVYTLSARVRPAFAGTFDAGVLMIYQDERMWAKLCFEFSPQRQPMVVSVVTRALSDDCNSVPIDQDWVELRIARTGPTFAFHYSLDGHYWNFVRLFALGDTDAVLRTGFLAQSPMGDGSRAVFSHVRYEERALADYRDGS